MALDDVKKGYELVTSVWDKLCPYWKTKKGFYLGSILVAVGEISLLRENWSSISSFTVGLVPPVIVAISLSISVIAISLVTLRGIWLLTSGRKVIHNAKYVIAFCLKRSDLKANQYFRESLDELAMMLTDCGLSGNFQVIDIGSDIVKNDQDAHDYVTKNKVNLLFHGIISSGTVSSAPIHEHKMRITWLTPVQIGDPQPGVHGMDFHIFAKHRDWNIRESDSKPDKEKVADSFHEIILFLVALSQLNQEQEANENILLLENVFKRLNLKTRDEKPTITGKKKKKITMSVQLLRKSRVATLLKDLYRELARVKAANGQFNEAIDYLHSARSIPGPNYLIHMLLAYCSFHAGAYNDSIDYNEQIEKEVPNHPAYLVNKAFFGLYEKKYSQTADYYKRLLLIENVDAILIMGVNEFLSQQRNIHLTEPAYQFAVGYVNYCFIDQHLGREDLKKFIKTQNANLAYRQLIETANELLALGVEKYRVKLIRQTKAVGRRSKKRKP